MVDSNGAPRHDPEVRALVIVVRDALVYVVRWLERRYGLAK